MTGLICEAMTSPSLSKERCLAPVVVQTMLATVGFQPSGTVAVTDFAQYVAHCARPGEVLDRLGVAKFRQDDLLDLL